ncbi:hypothetical protein OG594_02655 [Streptomyces sp. NBC_01214]|uniref:hypothetical protein n=1 Tax=Streptomyces sp. NBC_01214 TaxID=2903777 RepID=UPI0022581043|nr:hypothetical protein [Streptomyces sp. NBC_01214]MCX4800582.1 hypothetical protein [Streptomyces sp. NBC_01214]
MPIKVLANQDGKSKSGVQVCVTHGVLCEKYPDHPQVRKQAERERASVGGVDQELMEMIRDGRLLQKMDDLRAAGYELPGEFIPRVLESPPGERVRLFFETYDLCRHFPGEPVRKPQPCKPRRLSPEEINHRFEWARQAKEAEFKRRNPPPPPVPWEATREAELYDLIRREGPAARQRRAVERAAHIKVLAQDDELRRKLAGALETWVNSPRRFPKHTQDVREGYGDAVPEFEEME